MTQSLSKRAGVSVEFVNHASFIIESNGLRIINDPWLFGTAFNQGWGLLCDYPFDLERFREMDYIWISHEHPDHFSPHVLNSIPEDIRRGITVMFQETKDRKIIDFCASIGFQTRELSHLEPVRLADNAQIICGTVPFYDSWILYDLDGTRVLNINDCVVDGEARAEHIKKATGRVDVLFTQFSYAGWNGNAADTAMRRQTAAAKLKAMRAQIEVFEPEWTVPFASFAYFSHQENRHSNDGINKPIDAINAIDAIAFKAVLMYPGDRWNVGDDWTNGPALRRYEKDYEIAAKEFETSKGVSESELIESARAYTERIHSRNNRFLLKCLRLSPFIGVLRPIDILVHDLECTYNFSLERGLVKHVSDSSYHIKMHSSSLDYLFRFEWGLDTLTINGRFETNVQGFRKMKKTFAIGPINNTGRRIGLRLLFDVAFLRMVRDAALRLRKRGE